MSLKEEIEKAVKEDEERASRGCRAEAVLNLFERVRCDRCINFLEMKGSEWNDCNIQMESWWKAYDFCSQWEEKKPG